ncbi:MAG: hypothetical protein AAFQ10_03350 [Pseudomonadota bacterium]
MMRRVGEYIRDWTFFDYARPVEIISFWAMIGFGWRFYTNPQIVQRDSYTLFEAVGADVFAFLPILLASLGAFAMHVPSERVREPMRVLVNSGSFLFWFSIATAFLAAETPTTAHFTYYALSFGCILSGVYLAWKSS